MTSLQVASGDNLEAAQDMLDLFKTILWVLLVLTLAAFGAAIWLSRDRRSTIIRVGGCIIFAGVALLAVRRLGGLAGDRRARGGTERADVADDAWVHRYLAPRGHLRGLDPVRGVPRDRCAWLAGEGRRATSVRRSSAYALRERPGAVRAGLGVAILLLVIWGPVPGPSAGGAS